MHDNNERLSSTVKMYSKESPNCSCFPLDGASRQECISHASHYCILLCGHTQFIGLPLRKQEILFVHTKLRGMETKLRRRKGRKGGKEEEREECGGEKNSWNNFRNLPNWLQLFSGGGGEKEMAISPS